MGQHTQGLISREFLKEILKSDLKANWKSMGAISKEIQATITITLADKRQCATTESLYHKIRLCLKEDSTATLHMKEPTFRLSEKEDQFLSRKLNWRSEANSKATQVMPTIIKTKERL